MVDIDNETINFSLMQECLACSCHLKSVSCVVFVTVEILRSKTFYLTIFLLLKRARLLPSRVSKIVKFENPGYSNQGQIKVRKNRVGFNRSCCHFTL